MAETIPVCVKHLSKKLKSGARILDVGPGHIGRNSLFLAKKGFIVDAIDRKKWVKNINSLASANKLKDRLNVWMGDIKTARLGKEKYDAVLMCR